MQIRGRADRPAEPLQLSDGQPEQCSVLAAAGPHPGAEESDALWVQEAKLELLGYKYLNYDYLSSLFPTALLQDPTYSMDGLNCGQI